MSESPKGKGEILSNLVEWWIVRKLKISFPKQHCTPDGLLWLKISTLSILAMRCLQFLKPGSAHLAAQGVLLYPLTLKLHLEKCTVIFPHGNNAIFSDKCLIFPILLMHLSYPFSCLWKIDEIGFQSLFRGQHCKKYRSYEYRHQSDTVCHNIFDSYICESTRNPVNIPEIDKIMPYHQTSGPSMVEAYDTKRGIGDPLTKSN